MDATTATVDQVRRLVDLLSDDGAVPLFVFDAGYDPIAIGHELAGSPRRGALSHSRRPRPLCGSTRASQPSARDRRTPSPTRPANEVLRSEDVAEARRPPHGHRSAATGPSRSPPGTHLHPRLSGRGHWTGYQVPPIVKGSVIRVEVEHLPKPTARTKKTLWMWWSGDGEPDLDLCWRSYLRRFDIEHTFRFVKGTLGWTTPSVCTPEQADRWTWLVDRRLHRAPPRT